MLKGRKQTKQTVSNLDRYGVKIPRNTAPSSSMEAGVHEDEGEMELEAGIEEVDDRSTRSHHSHHSEVSHHSHHSELSHVSHLDPSNIIPIPPPDQVSETTPFVAGNHVLRPRGNRFSTGGDWPEDEDEAALSEHSEHIDHPPAPKTPPRIPSPPRSAEKTTQEPHQNEVEQPLDYSPLRLVLYCGWLCLLIIFSLAAFATKANYRICATFNKFFKGITRGHENHKKGFSAPTIGGFLVLFTVIIILLSAIFGPKGGDNVIQIGEGAEKIVLLKEMIAEDLKPHVKSMTEQFGHLSDDIKQKMNEQLKSFATISALDSLKADIATKLSQVEQSSNVNKKAIDDLNSQVSAEIKGLKSKVENLQKSTADQKKDLDGLQAQMGEHLKLFESKSKSVESSINSILETLKTVGNAPGSGVDASQLAKLNEKLASLSSQILDVEHRLNNLDVNAEFKSSIETLQSSMRQVEGKMIQFEEALKNAGSSGSAPDVSGITKKVSLIENQISDMNIVVMSFENKQEQYDGKLAKFESDMQNLEKSLSASITKIVESVVSQRSDLFAPTIQRLVEEYMESHPTQPNGTEISIDEKDVEEVVLKIINDKAIQNELASKISQSDTLQDSTKSFVKSMTDEALKKYVAGQLASNVGLPDHALWNLGGRVRKDLTSPLAGPSWMPTFFSRLLSSNSYAGPPNLALTPSMTPGECWAFQGHLANFTVQIPNAVTPSAFTIDHILFEESINPETAPREFRVFGVTDDLQFDFLVSGTYNNRGSSAQTFKIPSPVSKSYRMFRLNILSNWGHEYSCLYRFRVHGQRDLRN